MKHLAIHVKGKVQGVFFRATAKEKAEELGIKGTVRNIEDGSVLIEAEGINENLIPFVEWCKKGPLQARVDDCKVHEGTLQYYADFSIQR